MSTVRVDNLLLTTPSVDDEAHEVEADTPLSDVVTTLAKGERLKYQGKRLAAEDIVTYMAGGGL